MKNLYLLPACAALVFGINGCTNVVTPAYTVNDPDVMQISTERPAAKPSERINLGSFCVDVQEEWKSDGATPDGQQIWTKDTYRKATACQ